MIEPGTEMMIEIGAGVEMVFCYVPAGEFRMGQRGRNSNEEPVHLVEIEEGFWLGKYSVTQEQFACWRNGAEYMPWFERMKELIKKTGYSEEAKPHENGFKDQPQNPADSVTWWEAVEFGIWIQRTFQLEIEKKLEGLGQKGLCFCRLPLEKEWEYACRAKTETEYYSGDGEEALKQIGWYRENAKRTMTVGGKDANKWRLKDMHGNVWEWCEDVFDERIYRKRTSGVLEIESVAGSEGTNRVLRGGSWINSAWLCRSACRDGFRPGYRFRYYGFRVGLFPGPPARNPAAELGAGAVSGGTERKAEDSSGAVSLDRNFTK